MYFLFSYLLLLSVCYFVFFFFNQKTAYEMRISDWSSDVCSSDLCSAVDLIVDREHTAHGRVLGAYLFDIPNGRISACAAKAVVLATGGANQVYLDRKSVL